MRLYSMTVQAVGPFAGRHTVDFAALGRAGLFLLEGPTGAGKSTLIDAVVFALYGQLAGSESSKQRLHSHHVDPTDPLPPEVDLVFEVEAGVFRVVRSPAHERPKRRGDGTRVINESVRLTRLADVDRPDDGEVLSTRGQEVGEEITRLVGLDRRQFLQTVVLPQGEFATFLRSHGEDRKKLLQRIFRTDVYEQITVELVERRRAAAVRTEQAEAEVRTSREVVARVAEVDVDDLDPASLATDVEQQRTMAAATLAAAAARRAEAEQQLRAVEALAEALARRRALRARAAALDGAEPTITAAFERIDAARRAAQVVPYVEAFDRTVREHAAAVAQHETASAEVEPGLDLDDARTTVDELGAELERLSIVTELVDGFARRTAEVDDLVARIESVAAETHDLQRREEDRPARREALRVSLTTSAEQLAQRGTLTSQVAEARARVAAAREADQVAMDVKAAESRIRRVHDDAIQAETVLHDLRLGRLQGMAGELASRLVSGEACVVCGSESHPRPAGRSADHPDDAAIEAAERHAKDAADAVADAKTVRDLAHQKLVHLRERAGDRTLDQARSDHARAVERLTELDAVQRDHDDAERSLAELELAADTDRAALGRLTTRRAALDEQHRIAAESLAADQQRVAEQTGDTPVADLEAQVRGRRQRLSTWLDTAGRLTEAGRRRDDAEHDLRTRCTNHGFVDTVAVADAQLAPTTLERLEHGVTAHRAERARVDEGLADPRVAALTGDEEVDVPAATDTRDAAVDAHDAAGVLAHAADRRATQVTAALASLDRATRALGAAEADARAVVRLAGLADASSPENLKRLTLGTYVLLRRFGEVVAAANERLVRMSDGRYELRVTEERERSSSARRTGLSMAVVDHRTGREREPRTLSGGEQFYFAVSLALGLADVVAAESGGVRLGTLFVDEGFGSLDAEKLDVVMHEFTELTAGGRIVGLVSHVEDLKQRVADRVEVRRGADGVSTLTVLA